MDGMLATSVSVRDAQNSLLPDFISVTSIPACLRNAHRKVNGANADSIPDIVIAAIAACYGNGGYPVHWDVKAGAYVMDTGVYHVEIATSEHTATMRIWPRCWRAIDYHKDQPTSIRRFVMAKRRY